ncbi:uncharacterized protein [Haliotis cracherodii]|uniref:uncharacterized protein n=1 Tax=Haliotis cracherodii TaxID=6455 RepID=UPI0039EB8C96
MSSQAAKNIHEDDAMQQQSVDVVAEGAASRSDPTDHPSASRLTSDPPDREPRRMNCCQRLCSKFQLNKNTTRPNYKYIALMFAALMSSSFTLTFLFPFLPDMVKWLGYTEEAKGYYVGLIASSVFAGRACGSFFWGWLSDVKGRKVVLLLTLAGNGIFSLLFGFSVNLPMAMILRFLAGLCNGTVGTAKTVLYEISDNTNQAIGMSCIALSWGTGLILGPTFGGFLASPASKYPSVFDPEGFFSRFPFVLPSVAVIVTCAIGFFVVLFQFEETLQKRKDEVVTSDPEEVDEVKPLTDKVSVSASRSNIYRSCDSLHRGPMAAMSIEDIHCVSETEGYFTRDADNHTSQNINKSIDLEINNHLSNKSDLEIDNHEQTALLDETEVKNAINEQKSNLKSVSKDHVDLENKVTKSADNQREAGDLRRELSTGEAVNDHRNGNSVIHSWSSVTGNDDLVKKCGPESVTVTVEGIKDKQVKSRKSLWGSIRNSMLVSLLCDSDIRNSILLYTVYSFGVIGAEDVFTIFLSTEPRYNGMGFTSNEIGLSMGVVSVPLLVLQLLVYPAMVQKFGIKKTFLIGGLVLVVTVQTLPMLHQLYDNKVMLWTLLMLVMLPERLAVNCCFSGSSLMINNSANPQNAGTVNGIAMTFTALARTLAPTVGGSVYAWSISYGAEHLGPPFDHNLAFLIFGLVFSISVIECLMLPESLNKQTKKS